MIDKTHYTHLSCKELRQMQLSDEQILLLDTLPKARYEKVHIQQAHNACVYEVTFLQQVAMVCDDKSQKIIVYGTDSETYDAVTAADKLIRDGYLNVMVLDGGLASWIKAGYQLAGEAVEQDLQTEDQLVDGRYQVDLDKSAIEWYGRNPNTTHWGTLRLSSGEVSLKSSKISGNFRIDMKSIDNINLAGDELKPVLEEHLKSDDFFFVKRFPEARFEMDALPLKPGYPAGAPNYSVKGKLSLCGITAEQDFDTTVNTDSEGRLVAEAHFDFDRTRWGIIYGSPRFFKHLGMHLVFDHITLQMRIIAGPVDH